ncbi:hypothetical protein B296_00009669 [Ensete ventricosum]|uniref:Uncharacterized protein n=1 Tax=Ensete ventricosum TaxID=4639 RepID=A0A427B6I2_ENSVE|nr:hypothetical protein B296_00009669 [Ensete ventricosum]
MQSNYTLITLTTYHVGGDLAVAEAAGGFVIDEVFAVGREVAFDGGDDGIVVAWVYDRVAENYERRNCSVGRPSLGLEDVREEEDYYHGVSSGDEASVDSSRGMLHFIVDSSPSIVATSASATDGINEISTDLPTSADTVAATLTSFLSPE